jgi:hypothetical protein
MTVMRENSRWTSTLLKTEYYKVMEGSKRLAALSAKSDNYQATLTPHTNAGDVSKTKVGEIKKSSS